MKYSVHIDGSSANFYVSTPGELHRLQNVHQENEVIQDLLNNSKSGDVLFDVGANIGVYSALFLSKPENRQVVAFEPHPLNYSSLKRNISLNDSEAVLKQWALSSDTGTNELSVQKQESGIGGHTLISKNETGSIEVRSVALDDKISNSTLPRPDIVKIDVEGFELRVLSGMEKTLRDSCRLVYCEVHPELLREIGDTPDEVTSFLENCGFQVFTLTQRENQTFLKAEKIE